MKITEGGALSGLNNVLGFPAGDPRSITEWDDGMLQQVLDISQHIRRARANLTTTGIFATAWKNTHSGAAADTVVGDILPYDAVPAVGAWPQNGVPATHDVWLIGIGASVEAVTGNFTAARLSYQLDGGVGFDAGLTPVLIAGTATARVTGNQFQAIIEYTQEVSLGALGTVLAEPDNKQLRRCPLPIRIPRAGKLRWTTRTAGAGASEYKMTCLFGLFPAGFGQDVAL